MDIQENTSNHRCIITHYTADSMTIAGTTHHHSVLLTNHTCETLDITTIDALTPAIFQATIRRDTEIVLFGTGNTAKPLPAPILHFLSQQQLPFEFMRTESAIRTYNTIVHDGREVVAILLLPQSTV